MADRAHGIPNTVDTRFAMASGSKAFTAAAVWSLVDDGVLRLDTPVRGILNDDLPLIDDGVTIEHLLSHTSGIGDYLDEEADWEVDDYILTVPVHELADTEAFLAGARRPPAEVPARREVLVLQRRLHRARPRRRARERDAVPRPRRGARVRARRHGEHRVPAQ